MSEPTDPPSTESQPGAAGESDASVPPAEDPLARVVIVLHQPQDLVNVALVVRAMMNFGLRRLRLVAPAEEFDPYRVQGIAHGSEHVVEATEIHARLDEALEDVTHVAGTSARRRSVKQQWRTPSDAAPDLLGRARAGKVALLFGREDRGLTNRELDRCDEILTVPTDPERSSLNLSHAALLVFYEVRQAARERAELRERDLSPKPTHQVPPATLGELESFFDAWQEALEQIGLFKGLDPLPKMRSFRNVFQRADLDRRETKLMEAVAYEIIHYARRERARIRQELQGEEEEE